VVNDNNFWRKGSFKILLGGFKSFASIEADAFNTAYLITKCSMDLRFSFNICCSLGIEVINSISFFWEISILVLLAPSSLELLDVS